MHHGHLRGYAAVDKLAFQRPQTHSDIVHTGRANSGVDLGNTAREQWDPTQSLSGRVLS